MNKEQLESMSDYELSCKVLEVKNDCEIMSQTMQLPASVCLGRDENGMVLSFNICNWSDMGPLIIKSRIDLISPDANGTSLWEAVKLYTPALELSIYHGNPLRAAAIAYLLMDI